MEMAVLKRENNGLIGFNRIYEAQGSKAVEYPTLAQRGLSATGA